jgi:hypothetical protein
MTKEEKFIREAEQELIEGSKSCYLKDQELLRERRDTSFTSISIGSRRLVSGSYLYV